MCGVENVWRRKMCGVENVWRRKCEARKCVA
jgi:hypothetical protein